MIVRRNREEGREWGVRGAQGAGAVRTWVTNLVQDMGGARPNFRGGTVMTVTTALRILSLRRWLVHPAGSGEPESKYDETSYFDSGVLALSSMMTAAPVAAV